MPFTVFRIKVLLESILHELRKNSKNSIVKNENKELKLCPNCNVYQDGRYNKCPNCGNDISNIEIKK